MLIITHQFKIVLRTVSDIMETYAKDASATHDIDGDQLVITRTETGMEIAVNHAADQSQRGGLLLNKMLQEALV